MTTLSITKKFVEIITITIIDSKYSNIVVFLVPVYTQQRLKNPHTQHEIMKKKKGHY